MEAKSELRTAIRQKRIQRGKSGTAALGSALCEELVRLVTKLDARTVATFVSTALEPPTGLFRQWASTNDIRVLLPRVKNSTTLEWVIDDGTVRTHPSLMVDEPTGPALASGLQSAELILVPAAAVGRNGTRLGWGGGFYDRALTTITPKQLFRLVAVVHDDEVYESLPREAHDIPVSAIMTPKGITPVKDS